MEEHYVVVCDPSGDYWEGAIVGGQLAARLVERGVDMLPVDPTSFRLGGIVGYARRGWGSGLSLSHPRPTAIAPITLGVLASKRTLHWIARVAPDGGYRGPPSSGILRVVHDPNQIHAHAGRLGQVLKKPDDVSTWPAPDAAGGWTVGGAYEVTLQDGHIGLVVYGSAPGMRVLWAAASQT